MQQQHQSPPQQQPQPDVVKPEVVKPEMVKPEMEQRPEAPVKPPGYASIAAGHKENLESRNKDEMPTIDDWNADIVKEEQDQEHNGEHRDYRGRGGRGGGRGRGGGNYKGRGGMDLDIFGLQFKSKP